MKIWFNNRGFNIMLLGMVLGLAAFALCSLPWDKPVPAYAEPVGFFIASVFAIVADGAGRLRLDQEHGEASQRLFSPRCGGHIMFVPLWAYGVLILLPFGFALAMSLLHIF